MFAIARLGLRGIVYVASCATERDQYRWIEIFFPAAQSSSTPPGSGRPSPRRSFVPSLPCTVDQLNWHTHVSSAFSDSLDFDQVLGSVIKSTSAANNMVIAHGQETMIALEAQGLILTDRPGYPGASWKSVLEHDIKGNITLATVGFPLDVLYAHYFSKKYVISPLQSSLVSHWINIYCADDYLYVVRAGRYSEG